MRSETAPSRPLPDDELALPPSASVPEPQGLLWLALVCALLVRGLTADRRTR